MRAFRLFLIVMGALLGFVLPAAADCQPWPNGFDLGCPINCPMSKAISTR